MRLIITSAALIFGLLGAGASPAFAAKGVKKKTPNGVHQTHGVVTHVQHHKTKNAAGHIGEITIKTHASKKKGQQAAAGNKASGQTHKFSVGANTSFSIVQGKNHQPASFTALRTGEHVSISHTGSHANSVQIHSHNVKKATNKKTLTNKGKAKKKVK
jgi:hypothetical protein